MEKTPSKAGFTDSIQIILYLDLHGFILFKTCKPFQWLKKII